jgi:hypothetical protein
MEKFYIIKEKKYRVGYWLPLTSVDDVLHFRMTGPSQTCIDIESLKN